MPFLLTDGKIKIGAYHFPDRKKPHICYENANENIVYDCGQFNNEDSAQRFMDALAKMMKVETSDCKQREQPLEERIKYLRGRYVDMCCMCTDCNCDECGLKMVIDDLDEILYDT